MEPCKLLRWLKILTITEKNEKDVYDWLNNLDICSAALKLKIEQWERRENKSHGRIVAVVGRWFHSRVRCLYHSQGRYRPG